MFLKVSRFDLFTDLDTPAASKLAVKNETLPEVSAYKVMVGLIHSQLF
jgi:hypothetical protein